MTSQPGPPGCATAPEDDLPEFSVVVHRDLAASEPAWRALDQTAVSQAFDTFAWTSEWYACIGRARGVRPHVVLVRGPGDAVWMVLPLALVRRFPLTSLEWLGGEISDFHAPLISPQCPPSLLAGEGFRHLWRAVLRALPRFDYLRFVRQLPTAGEHRNPLLELDHTRAPSSAHRTALGPDWMAYYQSKASSRTRQTHRRKARKLALHGEVHCACVTDAREAEAVIPVLLEQKSASYRELGVVDLFADPAHQEFLRRMTMDHPEMVHFSRLRVGERIVATHWGLLHAGHFYYLFPTYELGPTSATSPGEILRLWLLEWACEHNVQTFDFTVGEDAYKFQWAETATPLHTCLVADSVLGRAGIGVHRGWAALKGRIKGSERLYPLALGLRAWLFGQARTPAVGGVGADDSGQDAGAGESEAN